MTAPLCIDLCCGLGGWAEGFLAEGYSVIGFDIERHDYGAGGYPGQLVLQDVTTLHGSQFKDATVIVASPPCTEYSYMAMPWSRSKQIAKALRRNFDTYTCNRSGNRLAKSMAEERNETCLGALVETDNSSEQDAAGFPEGYTGSRTVEELTWLFMACFRIQREASEAAGHDIPLVVENVRGAQPWVSQANANFGSFYLWGDVGMVGKRVVAGMPRFGVSVTPMKAAKVPGFRFDGNGGSFQTASVEAQNRNPDGTDHGSGSWFKIADSKNRGANARKVPGISFNGELGQTSPGFNVTAAQRYREGVKQSGIGGVRTNGKGDKWFQDGAARHGSKSDSRKAASAMIAKIPFPLARYIAQVFKPQAEAVSA